MLYHFIRFQPSLRNASDLYDVELIEGPDDTHRVVVARHQPRAGDERPPRGEIAYSGTPDLARKTFERLRREAPKRWTAVMESVRRPTLPRIIAGGAAIPPALHADTGRTPSFAI